MNALRHMVEELAMALGKPDTRVYRAGEEASTNAPRAKTEPVRLLTLCGQLPPVPPLMAVLGVADDEAAAVLQIDEMSPILIVGDSGAGKTALARTIITSLAMHNRQSDVQFVLLDPKGRGLGPLACLPHVLGGVARTPEASLKRLRWLVSEMELRERENVSRPALVLAVDELTDLLDVGGKQMEAMLTRLAQRGRDVGIHIVACTRGPKAALDGGMVANFPIRLVGSSVVGAFRLVTKSDLKPFQAAWLGPTDLKDVAGEMSGGERISRQWTVQSRSDKQLLEGDIYERAEHHELAHTD